MTPAEKNQRVAELVESALELEPTQWEDFLNDACRDQPNLRAEVESLLDFDKESQDFIEQSAIHLNAEKFLSTEEQEVGALKPGDLIADYKIVSLLGQGGMGEVYLAEDPELGRQVAVKLVRQGLGTRSIIERFRYEERILAGLNHPNIARLYDAGVTSGGSPYFIMEYIEGERLDEYCDRRVLSLKGRLELFRKVCAAVGYAHQHLVIHRDIKPANIRVTPDGEPKLLDFGIAKLLDAENSMSVGETISLHGIMTPEYASPEQVRGESMTTASDIYSLGVVLYELLTGQKPFRPESRRPEKISDALAQHSPPRPSTALTRAKSTLPIETRDPKSLRGDVDNIVLMAIRQEPARRYSSVGQFSEDIRRHLAGRPVIARKDVWSYRASKFIKRNKTAVIAAALVVLALMAGIVTTTWQAQVAKAERARAERRFNDVRKLANSYLFELHDAIEKLPGSTPARELLVKRALEYLDSLAQESHGDPSLQRELISAYLKVGNVQGNPNNANLGDSTGALLSYRKALALAKKLITALPSTEEDKAQAQRLLAVVYEKMADVLAAIGQIQAAVQSSADSLRIFQAIAETQPNNIKATQSLAISHIKAGDVLGNPNFPNSGDSAGALKNYRSSFAIWQRLTSADPHNMTARRFIGLASERIGTMLEASGKLSEALDNYRKSLVIREALATDFPTDSDALRDVAITHEKLANILTTHGELPAALDNRQKSLEILKGLVTADPQNMQARQSLAISYVHLGDLFGYPNSLNLQRAPDARQAYGLALETLPSAREIQSIDAKTREILALVHERIGTMAAAEGKTNEALQEYHEAFRINKTSTTDSMSLQATAELSGKLGQLYVRRASDLSTPTNQRKDAWREACDWYKKSRTTWENLRNRGVSKIIATEKIKQAETEIIGCTNKIEQH